MAGPAKAGAGFRALGLSSRRNFPVQSQGSARPPAAQAPADLPTCRAEHTWCVFVLRFMHLLHCNRFTRFFLSSF